MRRLSRRMIAVLAAAVVVIVAAGMAIMLLHPWRTDGGGGGAAAGPPEIVVVRTSADPGEQQRLDDVTRLLTGLPGRFAAGDAEVLAGGVREEFPDVRGALPAGTVLIVDPATWRRTGAVASVAVSAQPPGTAASRFIVVVVFEDGAWRVLSTTPIKAAA
ncbi:hypothetical protein [Dactylosporangium sp. NPDC051541]|uniref:hypothetical protein n=1 Tax=Dactylosporangium sp. NPDC051541 TaxID=3363977 RepID=UPI0037969CE0